MSTAANDHLKDWLRDAHAMEKQAESMLTAQAERFKHYPELRVRIMHIEETRGQQNILNGILTRCGIENSVLKDLGGRSAAFGQGVGGMMTSDKVVKGAMAGFMFENLESRAIRR